MAKVSRGRGGGALEKSASDDGGFKVTVFPALDFPDL